MQVKKYKIENFKFSKHLAKIKFTIQVAFISQIILRNLKNIQTTK